MASITYITPKRLSCPKVRRYLLGGVAPKQRPADRGPWVDVDWDTAVRIVAQRLHAIRHDFGADAVGFLSSAKCTNEENYLVQKMARQLIGTNNVRPLRPAVPFLDRGRPGDGFWAAAP